MSNPYTTISFSTLSSSCKFEFPANVRRTNPSPYTFRGKLVRAASSSSSSSTTNSKDDPYRDNNCGLHGRRKLIFTTTLPFLLQMHASVDVLNVNAAIAQSTIQEGLRKVLSKGKAAGVLRLVFHDAGTFDIKDSSGGMNGSIVYELDRQENTGLTKSLKILEKAKNEVDVIQSVSWADMIALAGAEVVSLCGGPRIPVQLGRLDSLVPDPEGKLPEESLNASGLKQCFLRKGFSAQELVALSGAHTLGSKGFGNPTIFDNSYYKILLDKPWTSSGGMSNMIGLPSDRALSEDEECLRWIRTYAEDQKKFFEDFKNAYIKLVNSGASWENA